MKHLRTGGLGLLGRLSCNRTVYHVNRARGTGPYMGCAISSCAVLQEQSCIRTSSSTYTKSLGIRYDPHYSYPGTTVLRQNQRNFRLISTHAAEEGVEQPTDNEWIDRFPPEVEVHDVEVKRKGRNTGWESVKAMYRGQRAEDGYNGRAFQRRVWISISGSEPTQEELVLKWPKEKQPYTQGRLRDRLENQIYDSHNPLEFKVTVKTGENGRRFWRETTKSLSLIYEERDREWHKWRKWMRDEGVHVEIGRLMMDW